MLSNNGKLITAPEGELNVPLLLQLEGFVYNQTRQRVFGFQPLGGGFSLINPQEGYFVISTFIRREHTYIHIYL